jgi:hypothetical protein
VCGVCVFLSSFFCCYWLFYCYIVASSEIKFSFAGALGWLEVLEVESQWLSTSEFTSLWLGVLGRHTILPLPRPFSRSQEAGSSKLALAPSMKQDNSAGGRPFAFILAPMVAPPTFAAMHAHSHFTRPWSTSTPVSRRRPSKFLTTSIVNRWATPLLRGCRIPVYHCCLLAAAPPMLLPPPRALSLPGSIRTPLPMPSRCTPILTPPPPPT